MAKPPTQRLAQLYWQQSDQDFKLAKQALKKENFITGTLLAVQSVMNLLSSIWAAKARFQQPSYQLCELLLYCKELDSSFKTIENLCQKLDAVQELRLFDSKASHLNYVQTQSFVNDAARILQFCKKQIRENGWYTPPSFLG